MDVSVYELLLAVFLTIFGAGVVWGARMISRRSDAAMERTRLSLKLRHAIAEQPVAPVQRSAPVAAGHRTVPAELLEPEAERSWSEQLAADAAAQAGLGDPADDDPESSGRHRVPEELMRASTYWLSADRIARARVPGSRPGTFSDF